MRSEFAIDTLHLNTAGYDVLNQQLVTVLTSLQSQQLMATANG
jgi:hypothetical protein